MFEDFLNFIATEHPIALIVVVVGACIGYLYASLYKQYLRDWSSPSVRAKFKANMKRQLKALALALVVIGIIIFMAFHGA